MTCNFVTRNKLCSWVIAPATLVLFLLLNIRRVTLVQTSKVRTDPGRFISANYVARVFNNTPIILHFTRTDPIAFYIGYIFGNFQQETGFCQRRAKRAQRRLTFSTFFPPRENEQHPRNFLNELARFGIVLTCNKDPNNKRDGDRFRLHDTRYRSRCFTTFVSSYDTLQEMSS